MPLSKLLSHLRSVVLYIIFVLALHENIHFLGNHHIFSMLLSCNIATARDYLLYSNPMMPMPTMSLLIFKSNTVEGRSGRVEYKL